MERPRCPSSACGKDAGSRCDECSPDEKPFFAAHNSFIAALMSWNSKGKWTTKHCATHTKEPLDLWCDACRVPVCDTCFSHGAHKEHKTSAVSDVWRALQQDLQEQAGQLDAEIERGNGRLAQLTTLQEAVQREGSVGAARRALDEVEKQFADKMRVLRAELEAAAVSWQDRVAAEHTKLARRIAGVRALVESMRATCGVEEEVAAQRVVVEYEEQCRQWEALRVPLPSLVGCEVGVPSDALAALRKAMADLTVVSDGVVSCTLCEEGVYESSATVCESCKHDLCRSCTPCIACCVKAEKDALPEAVRDRVVSPEKGPRYRLAVAATYSTIGEAWSDVVNPNESLRLHNKAVSIGAPFLHEEKAPTSLELAATYSSMGKVSSEQGKHDEALDWYNKALVILQEKGASSLDLASVYHNTGKVLMLQWNVKDALDSFGKALSIREKQAPNSLALAKSYHNIGVLQSNSDEALRLLSKELSIHEEKAPNSLALASTYSGMGKVCKNRGKYDEALDWHNKALAIQKEKAPSTLVISQTFRGIGAVFINQSKYDEALASFRESLNSIPKETEPSSLDFAPAYHSIAFALHKLSKHDEALEWHKKTLSIYEETTTRGPHNLGLAATYTNLGNMAQEQSKPDEALDWFLKALSIYEKKVSNASDIARTYCNIGCVHRSQSKYDKALDWYNKALSIQKEKTPNSLLLAGIYCAIGAVLHDQSKYDEAMEWHMKALPICEEKAPNSLDLADTYCHIGAAFQAQSKYDEALHWYRKGLPIREEKAASTLACTHTTIEHVLELQGKREESQVSWTARLLRPWS